MIRIAYVIHKPRIGGAELHLLEVVGQLDRSRFYPLLVFLGDGRQDPVYQRFVATGAEIINLDLPDGMLRFGILQKLLRLARTLRKHDVDVVHGYLSEGNLVAAVVGLLAGIRTRIASKRSLERHSRKQLAFAKLSNRLCSHITAVSKAVGRFVQETEGADGQKITVIPNGVPPGSGMTDAAVVAELRDRLALPADGLVIGTVARFDWKKGYQYFIQAAALVVRELPTVRFVAYGDGPLRDEMEALVDELGLRANVVFSGWEADVRTKLGLFDVYVCASVIEGMSNAILEAMAERRPVIATAVGGNPETISDGETGYLVPAADPAALAERILYLARDSERRDAMGEAARESVLRDFTVQRMVGRMQEFYLSLAASRQVSGGTSR